MQRLLVRGAETTSNLSEHAHEPQAKGQTAPVNTYSWSTSHCDCCSSTCSCSTCSSVLRCFASISCRSSAAFFLICASITSIDPPLGICDGIDGTFGPAAPRGDSTYSALPGIDMPPLLLGGAGAARAWSCACFRYLISSSIRRFCSFSDVMYFSLMPPPAPPPTFSAPACAIRTARRSQREREMRRRRGGER